MMIYCVSNKDKFRPLPVWLANHWRWHRLHRVCTPSPLSQSARYQSRPWTGSDEWWPTRSEGIPIVSAHGLPWRMFQSLAGAREQRQSLMRREDSRPSKLHHKPRRMCSIRQKRSDIQDRTQRNITGVWFEKLLFIRIIFMLWFI